MEAVLAVFALALAPVETAECEVDFRLGRGRAYEVRVDCGAHNTATGLRVEAERQMSLLRSRRPQHLPDGLTATLNFERASDGGWRPAGAQLIFLWLPYLPLAAEMGEHAAACSYAARVERGRARHVCVVCDATAYSSDFEQTVRRSVEAAAYTHASEPARYESAISFKWGGPGYIPLRYGPPHQPPDFPPVPACPEAG